MSEGLDFEGMAAANTETVLSATNITLLLAGAIVAFLATVAGSTWLAHRYARMPATRLFLTLREFPPAFKLVALGVCGNTLIVQALAVSDVYMQTKVVHASAHEYFQYLSWVRLLGTSHAHVFGFMVLYGALAVLLSFSSARPGLKFLVISVLTWAGVFDVASWWGMKAISGRFEFLAALSGMASSVSSLVAVAVIIQNLGGGRGRYATL